MTDDLTERLKAIWDKKSEYVISGSIMYQVFTPNGKDNPIFVEVHPDIGGYGDTSTGIARAPEPNSKRKPPRAGNPRSDITEGK